VVGRIHKMPAIAHSMSWSSPSPPIEPLSGLELENLQLMASGLSNHEIAEQLRLALGTVKAHLHNV
jgi:ATP/maltotriose-dependent transcriptional regulator MalT